MRNKKVLLIVQAALIAAIYVVLTYFISAFNLASGAIQVRISEALTILPVFTPAAIPGLFIGCLLSNLLTGCMPLDVVFGSLADTDRGMWNLCVKKAQMAGSVTTDRGKYDHCTVCSGICVHGRGDDPILYADCRNRRSDFLLCVRYDLV